MDSVRLFELLGKAATMYHDCLLHHPAAAVARAYVEQRGLTPRTLEAFQIGYALDEPRALISHIGGRETPIWEILNTGLVSQSVHDGRLYDRFRGRLMIPIRDKYHHVVGFGARTLEKGIEPKYLNSPQTPVFEKSHLLFGLDQVSVNTSALVVVEGYFDVLTAYQAGFTNVVAPMGTALTEFQWQQLAAHRVPIYLAFDGDSAGQKAVWAALDGLRAVRVPAVRVVRLPEGKDPDDLILQSPEAWQALLDSAQEAGEWLVDTYAPWKETYTSYQSSALIDRLMPLLVALEEDQQRMVNAQRLAMRLGLSEHLLIGIARQMAS